MKNDVTIVIPTLNNNQGLKYLLQFFSKLDYPVIIIDNHLTSEKRLCTNNPIYQSSDKLIYLPQSANLGFAAAVNRAAELVKTDWMLILNDDIKFPPTTNLSAFFQQLIDYATKNHFIAVSPVLKKPDGEIENYGYRVLPYGRIELILQPPITSRQLPATNYQPPIDGLTAACLLIKADIFKKIGGFDESFFAYLEDVDFFLRLKQFAHQSLITNHQLPFGICPHVSVIHHHLTTSKTMGSFKQKQDLINWWRLILKHPKTFFTPNEVPLGGTKWGNFMNFINLLMERARNLSGLVKSYIK